MNSTGDNSEMEKSILLETYRDEARELQEDINAMRQPLGHGTTSEHLESILDRGLGADLPINSYSFENDATDLTFPTGIPAAYLFANPSGFADNELTISRQQWAGEDAISHYAKTIEKLTGKKIDIDSWRNQFKDYLEKRNPQGFPVLLIYDGEGEITVKPYHDDPAAVRYEKTIPVSVLRELLVPSSKIAYTEGLLKTRGLTAKLRPIELAEVIE